MNAGRSSLYAVGGVVSLNLLVFILAARFLFMDIFHHHWILPFETGFLGIQYVTAARVLRRNPAAAWRVPVLRTLFILLLLPCVIGILRFETVSTCVEGCLPNLIAAFVLAGSSFLPGGLPFNRFQGKKS